jgi:hypothetical protein
MKKITAFFTLAVVLLLLDLTYSFFQHYHAPLDGDMPAIILPAEHYQTVLQRPFGLLAVQKDTSYAGVNRFFVHRAMYHYYRTAPSFFRFFTTPVEAIYLSAAAIKLVCHAFLLWLIALYARGWATSHHRLSWLLPALLMFPLFQSGGMYYNLMGVVDRSPTYAFFYAFPLVLLLGYYYPAYKALVQSRALKRPLVTGLAGLALSISLPFSGPLLPGVVLVSSAVILLQIIRSLFLQKEISGWIDKAKRLPGLYFWSLLVINLLSLYSLYLGRYNAEQSQAIPLAERYSLLGEGLIHQFTNKLGPALLLLMLLANILLLRYLVKKDSRALVLKACCWAGLFSLFYLLLLPLGGYREYRPMVVRKDSILPVLAALFYLWGLSGTYLIQHLKRKQQTVYLAIAVPLLLLFLIADEPEFQANACERATLNQIAAAPDFSLPDTTACPILSWDEGHQQHQKASIEALLHLWKITEQ